MQITTLSQCIFDLIALSFFNFQPIIIDSTYDSSEFFSNSLENAELSRQNVAAESSEISSGFYLCNPTKGSITEAIFAAEFNTIFVALNSKSRV